MAERRTSEDGHIQEPPWRKIARGIQTHKSQTAMMHRAKKQGGDSVLDMPEIRDNIMQHLNPSIGHMQNLRLMNQGWKTTVRERHLKDATAFENHIAKWYMQQDVGSIVRGLLHIQLLDAPVLYEYGVSALFHLITKPSLESGPVTVSKHNELLRNMHTLIQSGGVGAVLYAMQVHRHRGSLMLICCGVMRAFLQMLEPPSTGYMYDNVFDTRRSWHQKFIAAGGMGRVFGVMEAHPGHMPLQMECLVIVGTYAELSGWFHVPSGTEGVKQVIDAMRTFPDNPGLQHLGARCILLVMCRECEEWDVWSGGACSAQCGTNVRDAMPDFSVRQDMIHYNAMDVILHAVWQCQDNTDYAICAIFSEIYQYIYYPNDIMGWKHVDPQTIPFLDGRASMRYMARMSSHYPQWSALFVRANIELAASTQWGRDMMETGGCEECVRLIGVTGSTSGCAWSILYDIAFTENLKEGLVNAGVISNIHIAMLHCSWEHDMGINEMKRASVILNLLTQREVSEATISPERMPMWMLRDGGLDTLRSLIDMDYSRMFHDDVQRDNHDSIVMNCMNTVRALYQIHAYRGPLNAFRRILTRNMPYSRFDALLDELQGGEHDVA